MVVRAHRTDLIREAHDLIRLLDHNNAALIAAGLKALAGKAKRAGDRHTEDWIVNLRRSSLSECSDPG